MISLFEGCTGTPSPTSDPYLNKILSQQPPIQEQKAQEPIDEKEERLGQSSLPTLPTPEESNSLSSITKVYIQSIKLEGHTLFDTQLKTIVSHYEKRWLTSRDLQKIQNQITAFYVEKGYVNSGAILPDQQVKDGIITLRIIEGKLSKIEVSGNTWLQTSYILQRFKYFKDFGDTYDELTEEKLLQTQDLQKNLNNLEADPRIKQVHAELRPGHQLGEGILYINVKEASPYHFKFLYNNYSPISIGSQRLELEVSHLNLSSFGDELTLTGGKTEGGQDYSITYTLPPIFERKLSFSQGESDFKILTPPFDTLDLQFKSSFNKLQFTTPIGNSTKDFWGLIAEEHHRESTLLGQPFSVFLGANRGINDYNVYRGFWDFSLIGVSFAMVGHWSFSFFEFKTDFDDNEFAPDRLDNPSSFRQRIEVFFGLESLASEIVFKFDSLVGRNLPSSEKLIIGGRYSVRGYRENLFSRDSGHLGSIEWRLFNSQWQLAIFDQEKNEGSLQTLFYVDYGTGENSGTMRRKADDTSFEIPKDVVEIHSIGTGFRLVIIKQIHAELFWAEPLKEVDPFPEDDLQENGIHFQLSFQL